MPHKRFSLLARVRTDNAAAVKPILHTLITKGSAMRAEDGKEFLVEAEMGGESARHLNRSLLSALRRVERRTRSRAEWTS
jgi:hypothetical protein